SIDQQLADAGGLHAAILVQFLAAFPGDGFDAALHRDAMCPAQQVEAFFVPKIDPGLKADLHRTFRDSFQQPPHVLSHAKNLIDEVDVLDSPAHTSIDLLPQGLDAAFSNLIAKQLYVAKSASPRAPTSQLHLGAN